MANEIIILTVSVLGFLGAVVGFISNILVSLHTQKVTKERLTITAEKLDDTAQRVQEVHLMVNDRLDLALCRIKELEDHLASANTASAPIPNNPPPSVLRDALAASHLASQASQGPLMPPIINKSPVPKEIDSNNDIVEVVLPLSVKG